MKIGIDCRMLGPAQGGLGRYIEQLILHLSQIDFANQYVFFLKPENQSAVKIKSPHFQYKKVIVNIPWYGFREQLFFKKIIAQEKIDLMHFPHWNVPLNYTAPFVVTIHDLLLLEYPTRAASTLGPVAYWFKNQAYKLVLRHAAKQAQHILTTSEFTKQDIEKKLGIGVEKMTVTYQAPFLEKTAGVPVSLSQWKITKPYALYVGVAYPHKNLDRLVEAWPLIQEKTNHAYQLVLAGKTNYFYQRLREKVAEKNYSDIVFTDFVQDRDLPSLYAQAALFVYPSLYEGFGLPPLEAWANNLPVAASDHACLPEVLGKGALFFDPESVPEIVQTITRGLIDQDVRTVIIKAATQEIKRFSWEKFASVTLKIYEKFRTQPE